MLRILCLPFLLLTLAPSFVGCSCLEQPYVPLSHAGSWDPILGECGTCGVCQGDCDGHTPGSFLKHTLTCGSGCGEIYWGPWISDPPDPCDPCDDCGNWTGPGTCCPPTFWQQLTAGCSQLWGSRVGGCDSCGGAMPCSDCGIAPTGGKGGIVAPPMKSSVLLAPASHHAPRKQPSSKSLFRSARYSTVSEHTQATAVPAPSVSENRAAH